MYNTLISKNYLPLFRDFDDELFFSKEDSSAFSPKANIVEKEKEFQLSVELPSLKQKDVEIILKDNLLTISGEKQKNSDAIENGYARHESHYGKFTRSWQLGDNVKSENISAKFEDGLLTVTVPKAPAAIQKQTTKKIAIS